MSGFRGVARALAVACVLAGCADEPKQEQPASNGSAVRPLTRSKDEERARAMRGLVYASGRAVRDVETADEVVGGSSARDAQAEFERGFELMRGNRGLSAIAALTKAVLLDPDEVDFYSALGDALLMKAMTSEAQAAYRTGLDLDGESTELRFKLADALARASQAEAAVAELRAVIERDPQHAEAHARLAIQLYYLEDYAGAWRAVHASEDLQHTLPPQFRALLERRSAEPAR